RAATGASPRPGEAPRPACGPASGPRFQPASPAAPSESGSSPAAPTEGESSLARLPPGPVTRRPTASFVANPVLVGAVTTLVVTVAVFLAYNANHGLPFVPTPELKVQLSNGSNLAAGNEVRAGGFRSGLDGE